MLVNERVMTFHEQIFERSHQSSIFFGSVRQNIYIDKANIKTTLKWVNKEYQK